MAIETKPQEKKNDKQAPLQFRDNPEVKKKIEAHKQANPDDAAYYSRLVREHPERAIDTLIYRDVQKHESEMRLIEKQLPQARAFYDKQTPEAKARIDRDLEGISPYFKDKAFVNAVFRENDRQTRSAFTRPSAGGSETPAPGADLAKPPTTAEPKPAPKGPKVA